MNGLAGIVFVETLLEIGGNAYIALVLLGQALKKIDIIHPAALRR